MGWQLLRKSLHKKGEIMIKNIVFDYGRVLAYPKTGNWFITPKSKKIIGLRNTLKIILRYRHVNKAFREAYSYLDENHLLHTETEEVQQFKEFYQRFLLCIGIQKNIEDLSSALAEDIVYNDDKVVFYDDVVEKMIQLKSEYHIAILSDTWPSLKRILDNKKITPILDGLIMSCDYGICKNKIELFHKAIEVLKIDPKCSLFIDDSESNLKNAEIAGFIPILMDRESKQKNSNFPIVHNIEEVILFVEKYNKE